MSRALAHALRHAPQRYDLDVDEQGWASIDDLLTALKREKAWKNIKRSDLEDMISKSARARYEIRGDRIRALHGHPPAQERLTQTPARPPVILYHGTDPKDAEKIKVEGLSCMLQPIRLLTTPEEALEAGKRKARHPIILNIDAGRAYDSGIPFYKGNDHVWLADTVPPEFIFWKVTP